MSTTKKQPDYHSLLKRALTTIDDLQKKLDHETRLKNEPIAIIGLGCRFPGGANNPEKFWKLLREGFDAVRDVPGDRWDADKHFDPTPGTPGKMYVKQAAFLDEVSTFDPRFFGIAPREAVSMDPQQRLLLEVTWEALEHAAQAPQDLKGSKTGVFIGISSTDYAHLQAKSGMPEAIDTYFGAGWAHSMATGRISYLLGLQGPSMAVDTACSASLMATHLAVQSLRAGESNMTIAGGINLILAADGVTTAAQAQMLSPDGRCKTFDDSANGYVRGEGCGIVILKRLSDAIQNNDNILAVISGTASNQDGKSSGVTAPNGLAQEAVIREALQNANRTPGDVSYIETHGTGTSLGDPIEVRSLNNVFGKGRSQENALKIGSVKTNVGHLEAAAGIVGLIKTVLALQNEKIPPHLHFHTPNQHIPWDDMPITVPTQITSWQNSEKARVAGLSSFGFSGTNVHMIIEGAIGRRESANVNRELGTELERPMHVLALSAQSNAALKQLADRYLEVLGAEGASESPLGRGKGWVKEVRVSSEEGTLKRELQTIHDICFSANAGRAHHSHRLSLTGTSKEEFLEKLQKFSTGENAPGLQNAVFEKSQAPEIVFMFTGQGAQYAGMAKQLYETQPTFRKTLDRCAKILDEYLETPLLDVVFTNKGAREKVIPAQAGIKDAPPVLDSRLRGNDVGEDFINQTAYTQPALFVVEYALAKLWASWGVRPSAVMGHSVGEYVAACIAGVFSLEDGLKLIAARGRLMQALPKNGAMVSVFANAEIVQQAIADFEQSVSIAAFNGPENTVISGEQKAIETILQVFEKEEIKYKKLTVSHAFHSPLMEPMLDEFERIANEVAFREPRLALISNVTGKMETGAFFSDAKYWRRHVREAVDFHASINWLHEQGYCHFLEIGPHPTLSGMGVRCVENNNCHWLPSLRREQDDWAIMLDSLAKLYVEGVKIDWKKFDAGYARKRVVLPTYPFQRERYWVKAAEVGAWNPAVPPEQASRGQIVHPLLGAKLASPLNATQFENAVSVKKTPFLRDHRFYDKAVFPATGYFELMLAAVKNISQNAALAFENIEINDALFVPEEENILVQTLIESAENGGQNLRILSLQNEKWQTHASAFLVEKSESQKAPVDLRKVETRCINSFDREKYYQRFEELGVTYGAAFQGIQNLKFGDNEALADVSLSEDVSDKDFLAHPALLDACVQLIGAALLGSSEEGESADVYMPVGLESLNLFEKLPRNVRAHAKIYDQESALLAGDISVYSKDGKLLAFLKNMRFKRVRSELLAGADEVQKDWLYEVVWRKQALTEERQNGALAKNWLIFADDGVGDSLAKKLSENSSKCTVVHRGEKTQRDDAGNWTLDLEDAAGFETIIQTCEQNTCIVYGWGLDSVIDENVSAEDLLTSQKLVTGGALQLVQACLKNDAFEPSRLWFMTRKAQNIDANDTVLNPAQAALWGFAGTVMMEQPALNCGLIDLDGEFGVESLVAELQQNQDEDRVVFRNGERFVARVQRVGVAGDQEMENENVFLNFSERGTLENLHFERKERTKPKPNEVEIRVRATGLNFRDVLNVLGMYPGEAGGLGHECAGEIVTVGEDVSDFKIGDEVIAIAGDSFANFITVGRQYVVPKPQNVSFAEAATIPVTFLTAHFALEYLGKMKKGDRVLIHAAAGGVGLAAVQLAQQVGAEIFATASPAKWDYLKSLGVKNVMNSRTLDFAEEIMRATNGEGVDFVLNSLTGDFITKSLEVLRDGGRFLEIGRTELLDEARLNSLGKKIHYDVIYLGENIVENPDLICGMLRDLLKHFESGEFKPLRLEAFPLEKAQEAFRHMAQAKHTGKVVLVQEQGNIGTVPKLKKIPDSVIPAQAGIYRSLHFLDSRLRGNDVKPLVFRQPNDEDAPTRFEIRSDATYLITGGLGALGLHTAEWLVREGAKNVILTGRSAPNDEAQKRIAEMQVSGAEVLAKQADIIDKNQVRGLIEEIDRPEKPLRGVFHAAGVLADGVLQKLDWSSFEKVMAPKIRGTWLLHQATKGKNLDCFVLYSSIASMFGSTGQGNYAAANAFMDAFSHYRQANGLAATSVNWGAWEAGGMVSDLGKRGEQLSGTGGVGMISPVQGVNLLKHILKNDLPQSAVLPVHWPTFLEQFSTGKTPSFYEEIAQATGENTPAQEIDLLATLQEAAPSEREDILTEHVREQVIRVLGLNAAQPPALNQGLTDLGMDSLMAVELGNRLQASAGVKLPSTFAFEYPSIGHIAGFLAEQLLDRFDDAQEQSGEENDLQQQIEAEVEELHDEEVESSLLDELEKAGF